MRALILLILLTWNTTQAQMDTYLMRSPVENSLAIRYYDTEYYCYSQSWDVPDGRHKILSMSYCCVQLGDDLIIDTTMTGVHPDYCTDPPYQMYMHDYIEFALFNCKGEEVADNYKESFALQDRFHFPYRLENGVVVNVAGDEWQYVTQYGIPDTILAYAPYHSFDFPFSTGVSSGKGDCYSGGYYNNGIIIDDLPDGYYTLELAVNLPPEVVDAGVYPNVQEYYIQIQGDSVWIRSSLPTALFPQPVDDLLATGRQIAWTGEADYYILQRYTSNKTGRVNQKQGPEVIVYTTSYTDNSISKNGWYTWAVRAVNCAGTSEQMWSNSQNINLKK